nr:hypothetical protein [Candidatus Brachybacter algidus]
MAEEFAISYPTNTMDYDEKMMSMRGNNPHFCRATVQHEVLPGHYLQHFMNEQVNTYRRYDTPFWTERLGAVLGASPCGMKALQGA